MSVAFLLTRWCSSVTLGEGTETVGQCCGGRDETFPDWSLTPFCTFLFPDLAADWHNQGCSCPACDESSSDICAIYFQILAALGEEERLHLPQYSACIL